MSQDQTEKDFLDLEDYIHEQEQIRAQSRQHKSDRMRNKAQMLKMKIIDDHGWRD